MKKLFIKSDKNKSRKLTKSPDISEKWQIIITKPAGRTILGCKSHKRMEAVLEKLKKDDPNLIYQIKSPK